MHLVVFKAPNSVLVRHVIDHSEYIVLYVFGFVLFFSIYLFGCVLAAAHRIFVASCGIYLCSTQTLWLWPRGSEIAAHRLSCSMACRIFVSQLEVDPVPPACKANS